MKYRNEGIHFNRRQKKSLVMLVAFLSGSFLLLVGIGLFVQNKDVKIMPEENIVPEVVEKEEILFHDHSLIRVLLTQNENYFFQKPELIFEGEYKVINRKGDIAIKKDKDRMLLGKKQEVCSSKDDCIKIIPQQEEARVIIKGDSGKKTLGYRGNLNVYYGKGGYFIVNELTVREYLYCVVPSEMPYQYELEALKAQAICARSYAYKQMMGTGLKDYYADVDDTTSYQVYHLSKERKKTCKAVDMTENMVIMFRDKIATAYYYSTSCGFTQSYDLWKLKKNKFGYLKAKRINEKEQGFDGTIKDYLKESHEGDLEKDYRYYRWKAIFSLKDNIEGLKSSLEMRKKVAPDTVSLLTKDGKYTDNVDELGNPKAMEIVSRDEGYGINKLEILFQNGKAILYSEYTIRTVLASCKVKVVLSDGAELYPKMLPSACFYVASDKKGKIVLRGGGFGHGLGMSQNGANEMAKQGKKCKEILEFFYSDTDIMKIM